MKSVRYCPKCGKAGVEGMKFCPQCGHELVPSSMPRETLRLAVTGRAALSHSTNALLVGENGLRILKAIAHSPGLSAEEVIECTNTDMLDIRDLVDSGLLEFGEIGENTSGQSGATIPEAIKGWNWGAFWFGWLWGVCNNTWIALLSLIPYAGFVMSIVLGIKGNEWAWRNKKWDSVEHFKRTQGNWAIAALVMFLIVVALLIIVFVAP